MQAIQWSRISSFSRPRLAALAAALSVCAALAAPADPRAVIEPELATLMAREQAAQRMPVIVRLKQQPDPAEFGRRVAGLPQAQRGGRLLEALKAFSAGHQAGLMQDLATRKAEGVQALSTVNAVGAHLLVRDIRELAQRADVASIRYDVGLLAPSRRLMGDPCKPERPTPRQRLPKSCLTADRAPAVVDATVFDARLPASDPVAALGAPAVWQSGVTGKGVTVAIIDTGVDISHPDLVRSFRGGASDWFDPNAEQKRPIDRHGHGTQIAGLVLGTGASGKTLGVAPQAQWIAARIYNNRNIARLSDLHRVMAWVLDPDGKPATADTPQIALNAWGLGDRTGSCDTEFATDIAWLRAAGVHVVFAGGNGGPAANTSVSPANNPGALSVGALDASGELASFSSRGPSACDGRPYPDIAASGEMVRTTDLSAGVMLAYTMGTGSSYAAALVAGELALLSQARPTSSVTEREAMLHPAAGDARPPLLRALGLSAAARAPGPGAAATLAATELPR